MRLRRPHRSTARRKAGATTPRTDGRKPRAVRPPTPTSGTTAGRAGVGAMWTSSCKSLPSRRCGSSAQKQRVNGKARRGQAKINIRTETDVSVERPSSFSAQNQHLNGNRRQQLRKARLVVNLTTPPHTPHPGFPTTLPTNVAGGTGAGGALSLPGRSSSDTHAAPFCECNIVGGRSETVGDARSAGEER